MSRRLQVGEIDGRGRASIAVYKRLSLCPDGTCLHPGHHRRRVGAALQSKAAQAATPSSPPSHPGAQAGAIPPQGPGRPKSDTFRQWSWTHLLGLWPRSGSGQVDQRPGRSCRAASPSSRGALSGSRYCWPLRCDKVRALNGQAEDIAISHFNIAVLHLNGALEVLDSVLLRINDHDP